MQRRGFLFTAAAASRVLGANDRVRVGLIGCGGRGRHDARHMRNAGGVDFIAVCDVDRSRREEARAWAGPEARPYGDFRQLLEQKDVDAVLIATPDHWHAIPTIFACEAGKHVYVEKPLSHSIVEGRAMVEAARRSRQVVQAGMQQRSAVHFPECAELVQSGKLGQVRFVRVWNYINMYPKGIGRAPDSDPPEGLDWDSYLGPAPKRPFNRLRFGGTYRWFWDYSGGYITDFGTHRFDTVYQIMGDTHSPRTVATTGGKFTLQDDGEVPDLVQATYQFDGWVLSYEGCQTNSHGVGGRTPGLQYYRARGEHDRPNGMAFYGTAGTLIADRYAYEVYPEPGSAVERRTVQSYDATDRHTKNFIEAIRGVAKQTAPIELGHRATTVALLGNVSLHSGHKIAWDAEKERCVDDPAANRFLGRPGRKPWDLIACPTCS